MADLLNLQTLWLPFLTAWTHMGGLPKGPRIISELARNELFQWFTVFLLILQSYGAAGKVDVSLVTTLVVFLIVKLLDGAYFARECPAVPLASV